MLRRHMEILKAFQDVDLAKQPACQLPTDMVIGMPLQYHTILTALVPLHVGAVFHRQATKLTDELEYKNEGLNGGATMITVAEMEDMVQAVSEMAGRCDADAMAELRRAHYTDAGTVSELLSGDGGAVVQRATYASAVHGRGGGMGGTRMTSSRPMPGRGGPRVQPQGGQYQRQAEQRQSEVRLRMGPVPSEWGFGRIKDAVHLITQVEAKYVSPIGPDQMVTVSFQDGPSAETAARGLNGRQLFAGGPTITATVLQPSAVANRAQMEWLDDGGGYGILSN